MLQNKFAIGAFATFKFDLNPLEYRSVCMAYVRILEIIFTYLV